MSLRTPWTYIVSLYFRHQRKLFIDNHMHFTSRQLSRQLRRVQHDIILMMPIFKETDSVLMTNPDQCDDQMINRCIWYLEQYKHVSKERKNLATKIFISKYFRCWYDLPPEIQQFKKSETVDLAGQLNDAFWKGQENFQTDYQLDLTFPVSGLKIDLLKLVNRKKTDYGESGLKNVIEKIDFEGVGEQQKIFEFSGRQEQVEGDAVCVGNNLVHDAQIFAKKDPILSVGFRKSRLKDSMILHSEINLEFLDKSGDQCWMENEEESIDLDLNNHYGFRKIKDEGIKFKLSFNDNVSSGLFAENYIFSKGLELKNKTTRIDMKVDGFISKKDLRDDYVIQNLDKINCYQQKQFEKLNVQQDFKDLGLKLDEFDSENMKLVESWNTFTASASVRNIFEYETKLKGKI